MRRPWEVAVHGALVALTLVPLLIARPAGAEVALVEDEIVFKLTAPGAREVFLVGDFNNWNPTLEKMNKQGDVFTIMLFLLPGNYRYKFVVDGQWMADPDDPQSDARLGTPLFLEERSGMLVIGAGEPETPAGEWAVQPSVRYAGAFSLDDGDGSSLQVLDLYFSYSSELIAGRANFKTLDSSWELSPLRAQIDLDRGHLDLMLGRATATGFENDSTWTSTDPFRLVGDVGIFDYNAGFERRGLAADVRLPLNLNLRALMTDKIESRPRLPVAIPVDAFAGLAGPDTLVYGYENRFHDSDTWAFDLNLHRDDIEGGYTKRQNRGVHPGLLATVRQDGTDVEATTSSTREFWNADVLWAAVGRRNVWLRGAFGRSKADVYVLDESTSPVAAIDSITLGQRTDRRDDRIPLQDSRRWHAAVEFDGGETRGSVAYERNDVEFEGPIVGGSKADITTLSLDVSHADERWRLSGRLAVIEQNYNDTPDDFHDATPARNFWLDYRDRLDAVAMVGFDRAQYTRFDIEFDWRPGAATTGVRAPTARGDLTYALAFETAADRFFERIEYLAGRGQVEVGLGRGFYGQADARLARYDKPSWQATETFFDPYLECGYRTRWAEISVGFGFDPYVLDPVSNVYSDIGREDRLNRVVPRGLRRSQSALLGERLIEEERRLEDDNAFKLEAIVFF